MKSYLKFLSRNILYTVIEAIGLTVSLAFVILIGSYVWQQYRVTRENPDHARIYGLGTPDFLAMSWWDKESLEASVPEIEAITRISHEENGVATFDGRSYIVSTMEVDKGFFDIFPYYPLLEGSPDAFDAKDNVFVSRSFAARITEDGEDPVGKPITVKDKEYIIAGVTEDFRNTLIMETDILLNAEGSYYAALPIGNKFQTVGTHLTLFRAMRAADPAAFREKVLARCHENYGKHWQDELRLYRFDELFFHPGSYHLNHGNKTLLRLLTVVVLLLLLSAVSNYINLNLALTGRRAREMATRRLVGASPGAIVRKYIAESVTFTAVCFALALLLAYALVPMMGRLLMSDAPSQDISLQFLLGPGYISAYILGILAVGGLSGLLPARFAARYSPIDVVRGSFRVQNKLVSNKIFIVLQSALAVVLIAIALVMEVQMRHMVTRPLHADTRDRYVIDASTPTVDALKPFTDRLDQLPCVEGYGFGRGFPGHVNIRVGTTAADGETRVMIGVIVCDTTYFRLLGLHVREDFGHPLRSSMWLGEEAFRAAGLSDTSTVFPRRFSINQSRADYLGGIVEEFPTSSAAAADGDNGSYCGLMIQRPEDLHYSCGLLIKTVGDHETATAQIMDAYRAFVEEGIGVYKEPRTYGYIDDILVETLAPAQRTVRLMELFMVLAVLLSLLGLIAMSTYFSGEQAKGIAIRKVFGGTVSSELRRSVRAYMALVGIACLIGIPVAVWGDARYLGSFAYRITGYGWTFAVAVCLTVAVSFVSVLWQVLRSARTNPAVELKKE